jgi:hypothetical protein
MKVGTVSERVVLFGSGTTTARTFTAHIGLFTTAWAFKVAVYCHPEHVAIMDLVLTLPGAFAGRTFTFHRGQCYHTKQATGNRKMPFVIHLTNADNGEL